jgi:Eco57I restriction-modification methylase/restriction endonuclease TaqI-like protein
MEQSNILSWYETSLPAKERKRRGHFSTPSALVERILDACGYTPDRDLSGVRVLDPACGSGNFIVGTAHRLLTAGKRRELSHDACVALVQSNIWGFDPDPVACFLAEMQLQMVINDVGTGFIASASALHSRGCNAEADAINPVPTVHIHQADGLALAWEQGETIDLFLANPPYLAAKNSDLSGYRSTQRRGQSDSYLLFLNLALRVVRPNGWIGLILPDPFLARSNATRERQRLLAETTIHHLWHFSGVFAAHVGAVVLIAQKCPPPKIHTILWTRGKWPPVGTDLPRPSSEYPEGGRGKSVPTGSINPIPQSLFMNQPYAELRYLLGTVQGTLVERLHAYVSKVPEAERNHFVLLSAYVSIRRGEELSKDSKLLSERSPDQYEGDRYPVLRGGVDIHPYEPPIGQCWIAREDVVKPLECYLAPKLLVVKSTDRLQATLDVQGHVVLQTLYLLSLRNEKADVDQLYFLLALLNSRLLREYVYVLHTAYKWVQPQIEQHVLARLPIPGFESDEKHRIIACAKQLRKMYSQRDASVEGKREILGLHEQTEHAVCMLYGKLLKNFEPLQNFLATD